MVLQLLADHVVAGRIVFPGAGYLEMARAAGAAAGESVESPGLHAVFFLQPLVLEEPAPDVLSHDSSCFEKKIRTTDMRRPRKFVK